MNLVLTAKCNKNCKNCFALGYRRQESLLDKDLDLSFLEKIQPWDKVSSPDVGILGGEPTLSPSFFLILRKLWDLDYVPVVFSNFLFDDFFKIKLNSFIQDNAFRELKFLVNINDLRGSYLGRVVKNIDFIQKTLTSFGRTNKLSLSLTIDLVNFNSTFKYLRAFYAKLDFKPRLRIGVALPSDFEDKSQYKKIINNKNLGNTIINILQWSEKRHVDVFFDCGIYPCIFSPEDFSIFQSFFPDFKFGCGDEPAFDIFPDGRSVFCFPLKNQITNFLSLKRNLDSSIFFDIREAKENLKKQFIKMKEKYSCEECAVCLYKNLCEGVCPAFLKDSLKKA